MARLLGKVAEVLEDAVLAYLEVAPLLTHVLGVVACAEAKPETPANAKLLTAFLEALDVLTDCGAKLFKHHLHEIVAIVKTALQAHKLLAEHLDQLRQIALNFSYDLSSRILAKQQTTNDLIWIVVSGLVNPTHKDPGVRRNSRGLVESSNRLPPGIQQDSRPAGPGRNPAGQHGGLGGIPEEFFLGDRRSAAL